MSATASSICGGDSAAASDDPPGDDALSRPHRASELPVVRSVEDLYGLPQVLFFKIIGSRYLLQQEIANVTVVLSEGSRVSLF